MLKVCVIGLGYVGLPILVNFSKKYQFIGYDKSTRRINDLKKIKIFLMSLISQNSKKLTQN